ncbi:ankyrin repeat-containing domain protein [Flagelloscypha sp. PMI_526]|nr:ankyrin repeat-containing domain protein [Flagelloscypha sp. PMI_526]
MTARPASTSEREGITGLGLDGSFNPSNALSELYVLQETAERWAFEMGLDLRGEDVCPIDMFDIIGGTGIGGFFAVSFVSLGMTIKQVIQSHGILQQRLFSSDAWTNELQQDCVETLSSALDEIVEVLRVEIPLDSPFEEKNPLAKCFVCLVNTTAAVGCRLLRNYRSRKGQPRCTIRQVLHATLSNNVQLPAVCIEDERFLSALMLYANPTHVLVKELCNAFPKGTEVACLTNIGAENCSIQPLSNHTNIGESASLLRSCQLVADDVTTQCHSLGSFFFRFSVPLGLGQESHSLESVISRVKGFTMPYLSADDISTRLDDLDEKLRERFGVVSIERLNSVAGKDGESRVAAQLAKIDERLGDTIFQYVKDWLQPVYHTSKLDINIRTRSGATCRWFLENEVFLRWMEMRGLFWFRGLMGTGKTVMSSFVIETLLARGDIYVAYYYFEFTNPTTLSEEALLRSLVCQLAGASPAVTRTLHRSHNNGSLQPQLSTLQGALNELVFASKKPVFIIIDALDELPVPQRKYLLQFLVMLSASTAASKTHIMVTSREEVDIHRALEGKVDFELAVQGDLVRQDIAAFVDRELDAKKWTFWSRDAIELARRLLNERADGQFRMVACQIEVLQQVKTYGQLRQVLNSLPKSLGETYDFILEKIPEHLRDLAHRLFAILSFASESISTYELTALLAVELGDGYDSSQLPKFQEINRMVDPLDVVDLGTSLVSRVDYYDGTYLQFAHASVKEHLLSPCASWFFLCEDLAQSMIARSCLTLLAHFQILHKMSPFKFLCRYSARNWCNHVLPNGPPQLLRQQQQIYLSFPWTNMTSYDQDMYRERTCTLVSAASGGLCDIVETLLNARSWATADLDQALIAAASSQRAEYISIQCCHALINSGADVNVFTEDKFSFAMFGNRNTPPLQAASKAENLEIVRFLIDKGADVNARGVEYGTALHAAVLRGNLDIAHLLIGKGADVNARGSITYGTALHAIASTNDLEMTSSLEMARFLIEKGADVDETGGIYVTALQTAASMRNWKFVSFLIEKGADVNVRQGMHGTVLHIAAFQGNLEIIKFLIEKGADVSAVGGTYGTVLQTAVSKGNWEIKRESTALQTAASKGNWDIVRFLIEEGADVNAVAELYETALQIAIFEGNLEMSSFLVEKGADVNAVAGILELPLHIAARKWDLEIIQFLVENGADVNRVNRWSETALFGAASKGKLEVVSFLIDNGADVDARGELYGSALQIAASHGNWEIACLLIEEGADVNAADGECGTALQAAAGQGDLEIVSFLIEKGADVNTISRGCGAALQTGVRRGSLEVVRFLVENGANVNAVGGRYKTALDAARDQVYSWRSPENYKIAQFLQSCGAKTWGEMVHGPYSGCQQHCKLFQTIGH